LPLTDKVSGTFMRLRAPAQARKAARLVSNLREIVRAI
jgi:hypothetical protein